MTKEATINEGVWQGKAVTFEVMNVEITNRLGDTRPWAKPFIGETRQAVKITMRNHLPFYLDNEDGSGLIQLKTNVKLPKYRSLGEPKEGDLVPKDKWIKKYNKKLSKAIDVAAAAYWKDK